MKKCDEWKITTTKTKKHTNIKHIYSHLKPAALVVVVVLVIIGSISFVRLYFLACLLFVDFVVVVVWYCSDALFEIIRQIRKKERQKNDDGEEYNIFKDICIQIK